MIQVAKKFGADSSIDAYYYVIAFHFFLISIIQNVFKIVLLPILIFEKEKNPSGINLLYNNLLVIGLLISLVMTCMLIIFINLDISQDLFPKNLEINFYKNLIYLSAPIVFLNVLSSVVISIYNSYQKFWVLEVVFNSRIMVSFIIFYFFSDNINVLSLVLGNVLGQLIVLLVGLYYIIKKKIVRLNFELKLHSSVRSISKLSFFPLLSTILVAFQPLISNYFLVQTNVIGNVSLFNYSQKIASIPTLIFSTGMLTVFVSHVAKLEVQKHFLEIKNTITKAISFLISLLIPTICFLYLIRIKIIKLIFNETNFSDSQILIISNPLIILLISYLFLQIHSLVSRIFIVKQNTGFLFLISLVAFLIQIIAVFVFIKEFHYSIYGVPFALISTNLFVSIISFSAAYFKYNSIDIRYVLINLLKSIVTSLIVFYLCSKFNNYTIIDNDYFSIIGLFFLFSFGNAFILYIVKQQDFISLITYTKFLKIKKR